MTTEAADEGPPEITVDTASRYNKNARGPQAQRFVNVFHEALASGFDRNGAIREANAALRDDRDHPRPRA